MIPLKQLIIAHAIATSLALSGWLAGQAWAAPAAPAQTRAEAACERQESWSFSQAIAEDRRGDFQNFLSGKTPPVLSFSDAITFRMLARSVEEKQFSEYWISRSLLQARLVHIAHAGFTTLLKAPVTAETRGVQLAALNCLNFIHQRYPTLELPRLEASKVGSYLQDASSKSQAAVWDFAISRVAETLMTASVKDLRPWLDLLQGSHAHESMALGLIAAKENKHADTIARLEKLFATGPLPPSLKGYSDHLHLILARAFYAQGQQERATSELKMVAKSSNELASSLSELAWGYLTSDRYSEAIGTAMSLRAGGLRHTFVPESPMVMAMALNELCQYPESLKAIDAFKRDYEKPYLWLERWKKNPSETAPGGLYPQAVKFLRKQSQVPERVASEWVRSPHFISHQEEINLLFEERKGTAELGRAGSREQRQLARRIRDLANDLKPRIRKARQELPYGTALPSRIATDLTILKREITRYKRLRIAAPLWNVMLANHQAKAKGLERQIVAKIDHELRAKNDRMIAQIQEIAENNQLIEVEIYNGASQDIIWQNAHPDYKEVAKNIKDERQREAREKVWDWGRAPAGSEDSSEIWEDELGSFKANLFDNCESKDRYLAIKRKTRAGA